MVTSVLFCVNQKEYDKEMNNHTRFSWHQYELLCRALQVPQCSTAHTHIIHTDMTHGTSIMQMKGFMQEYRV